MRTPASRLKPSNKGRDVNRKREQEPDHRTTAGQTMRYIQHLIDRKGIKLNDDFFEVAGVHRATFFRWLRGEGSPTIVQLDSLAKALGFADAWALRPTKAFLDGLKK